MENAKKADAKDNDDVFSTSAKAFDTISPDGTAVKLQSSPLSATKRLYGADARSSRHIGGNASSSRISVGTSDVSTNKTSPSRRGQASLPSILPNSAFLTPRKPSHTPRYSQTNSPTSTPSSVARTALSTNDVDSSHKDKSPSHAPAFAEQQLQPSLFLANQPLNATRGKAQDSRGEPSSLFRSGSVSTHGRANASCVEGESNAGTLRGGFTEKHGRSESRQDTLRSKASAEPLISRNVANGNAQTTQRKNSRTGSITGLLGLRNSPQPSTSPRSRQESYTTQGPSMHTVQETAEKNRQSFTGAQPFDVGDARAHHQAGEQPIQSPEHTVVPVISSKTKKPMRNYQIYRELQKRHRHGGAYVNGNKEKPTNAALAYGSTDYGGNNRFLLRGRLVTSGDSPFPFIACLILSLILVGAFFAFESQWLWDASPTGFGNPGGKAIVIFFAYAALIMWTSMLRTSLRDPGIIVKGLDSEPDWESIAVPVGGEDDLTGTGMGQRPKLRYFRVRDENVSSKWCETCQTYRPPRTSHCRLCDVCTEQTDHHCSFLNNCIGRRNYSSFIAFLLATIVCLAFAVGVSAAHLARKASSANGSSFWDDWRNIGSIALIVLSVAVMIPITGLFGYHCRLIWLSKTTIEILRPRYPSHSDGPNKGKPSNPYAYSRRIDNIIYNLCKPMDLYSAIQPHALAEKDGRKENPAFE